MLFAGTCNTLVFNAWVEQSLLPELPPKSLVIMDNASFHKHPQTKKLIESHGHMLLYLAPYSPDHNPIEQTFAHLKARRRRTQQSPQQLLQEIS
jgi:transposase